jgi:hypothetical protein
MDEDSRERDSATRGIPTSASHPALPLRLAISCAVPCLVLPRLAAAALPCPVGPHLQFTSAIPLGTSAPVIARAIEDTTVKPGAVEG